MCMGEDERWKGRESVGVSDRASQFNVFFSEEIISVEIYFKMFKVKESVH